MTVAVPAGEVLAEKLAEMDLTQVEFAEATGLSKKHVNKVINGHATFTPEVALRFERVTGVTARTWLALQSDYQLAVLRADGHG